MAFVHSPKIVTDGLVVCLDAANPRSYVSGSTNWFNLVNSTSSGSLINGPTYSSDNLGSIVFDGVNDYVTTSSPFLNITSSITLETWLKSTALADANHGDGINSKGVSSDGNSGVYETLLVQSGSVNTPFFRMRIGSSTPFYNPNTPIVLNQIYHFVSTYDGNTMRIYINGIESGTGLSQTGTIESDSRGLAIGVRFRMGFDAYFNGNMFVNRIYNRALSATEIQQNYNATKGRYGL